MANGDDIVLTEAGALSAEEQAVREQAGTAAAEVSAETLASEYRAGVEEQIYGDAGDIALTAVEGGLRGFSFGGSDLLLGSEDAAARQRVNSTTALLSEFGGAVGASVLSGGSGTAGALARLTPQGRLSAMTARIVAGGGSSLAGRAGRAAVAGAIEGAAGGAGNYLSRVALEQDAEFSAEALLASAGMGAVLGGGISVGTVGVQSLGDVIAAKLQEGGGIGRLLDGAPTAARQPVKRLNYRQVLGKPKAERFTDDLAVISQRVDDAAALAASKELDDLLTSPAVVAQLGDQLPALRSRVGRLVEEQQQSAAMARDWATRYAGALGVQDLASARTADVAKVWAKEIPEELDEIGPRWLAQLDEDTARVTALRDELQGMATGAAPRGVLGRAADAATTAAGGLELAQDLGVGGPSLRNIPVIGEALSAFVRLRAGAKALQGVGLLPATRAVSSAAKVTDVRERIANTVGGALRRAAAAPAVRRVAVIAGKKAAAQIARLQQDTTAGTNAIAEAEQGDAGPVVAAAAAAAAERAKNYLLAKAPRNPHAGSQWADRWTPTDQQARDWSRRVNAVRDPLKALRTVMSTPFATIEAEALREAAPAIWAAAREQVIADAEKLARNLPPAHAMAVGRAFDVPLHPYQLPGAMALAPQVQALAPMPPNFGAPSVARTSPLVQDSETAEEARMRAR